MVTTAVTGADISPLATIGGGLTLNHPVGVVVGPDCVVGRRCALMQGVTLGHGRGGSPQVSDDVFVGPHAVLIGGITIGERTNIGANSVVNFSIPAGAIVRAPKAEIRKILSDSTEGARP
jgi:serine O-acetyltransferase